MLGSRPDYETLEPVCLAIVDDAEWPARQAEASERSIFRPGFEHRGIDHPLGDRIEYGKVRHFTIPDLYIWKMEDFSGIDRHFFNDLLDRQDVFFQQLCNGEPDGGFKSDNSKWRGLVFHLLLII